MTAHVRFPALDPDAPATISRRILTDLLRGELGFKGLCVTDSLDMTGIASVDSAERVISGSVAAGADAVMVTSGQDRQLAAADWLARGVPARRIAEAIDRAGVFRMRFARDVPDDDIDDEPARSLAREIAAASITHVGPPLPRLDGRVRVVAFAPSRASPVEELADPIGTLERALRARFGERVSFGRDDAPSGDGTVVVCTTNAVFSPEQAARATRLLADGGVLCALRSPYDATLVPERPALLSYCDVPVSLEALAAVLAGERRPVGRVPVRL